MNAKIVLFLSVTIGISNQYFLDEAGIRENHFPWADHSDYYNQDHLVVDGDILNDFENYITFSRSYYTPKRPYFKSFNKMQRPQSVFPVMTQHSTGDYKVFPQDVNLKFFRSSSASPSNDVTGIDFDKNDFGMKTQSRGRNKAPFSWHLPASLKRPNHFDDGDERQRFFFNYVTTVGSGYSNPFMKTIYYVTSSTATSCQFVTCIPNSLFDEGSSTVLCRRKKRNIEIANETDDAFDRLTPSPTQK